MKKQMLKSALIALAGVGLMSGSVASSYAASITGEILFSGLANTLSDSNGTYLDFGYVNVLYTSGSFNAIPDYTDDGIANDYSFNTINNIYYNTTTGTANVNSAPYVWEFTYSGNTYTFTYSTGSSEQTSVLGITLYGTLSITDSNDNDLYDDTYGVMTISTQGSTIVSWSATSAPVPEPTTMLLFGAGLIGFAGVTRKYRA